MKKAPNGNDVLEFLTVKVLFLVRLHFVLNMLAAKKNFVRFFLFLLVTLNESQGCLISNYVSKPVFIKSNDSFLKECSCDVTNSKHSADNLKWVDSNNRMIGIRWGLEQEPAVYTEQSPYSLTLYMPSASKELSGNYTCIAHNNGGTYVHVYQIEVYDPVQFIKTKSDQIIVKGKDSFITCEAVGYKQPEYHWHKDDEVIKFGNGYKYRRTEGGLIVKNVTEEDEGTYTCTATVDTTAETVSKYIKVKVFTKPEITNLVALPQSTVVSGDQLILNCTADGIPSPDIIWKKVTSDQEYTGEKNLLIFNEIQAVDRGTYECIAQNAAGVDHRNITIEVNYPPVIQSFENLTGDEGNDGRLNCRASGRPPPQIAIEYERISDRLEDDVGLEDDVSINFSNNTSETETEYELYFENLKRYHAGNFTCIASNDVGNATQVAEVSVNHGPFFDKQVETEYGWEGAVVRLKCEPDSQPPAHIVWSYKNSIIANLNRRTEVNGNQHLDIKIAPEGPQYGEYICTASNQLGTAKKYINLIQGFVPTKVLNVSISDIKASSVKVTFQEPVAGPNVISYIAEYDMSDIYRVSSIHMNRTWAAGIEYRLEKLKPGTKYLIRVAATNGVGVGEYSDLLEFETPRKSPPEMPRYEELTPIPEEGKVALKLIRPDDNGDPIDHYRIKYCPLLDFGTGEVNETMCQELWTPVNEEKVDLRSMVNGETYRIEMFAHNSEGDSRANEFNFVMPEDPTRDAPISAGVIIGVAVALVVLAILLLDLLLCATMKKGMMASCCLKKKKKKNITVDSRERKGLLKDNRDHANEPGRPNNNGKDYEYNNKPTGDITGKHSEV